ncbi:ATP-dependent nuclease [Acinetobacter sp. ANC 5584]
MYLKTIKINNFRIFQDFELELNQGLNLLIGENDSGKTALIDAIRLVLDTNSSEWTKFVLTDFHDGKNTLKIQLKFADLSIDDQSIFPEHITYIKNTQNQSEAFLYVNLTASIKQLTNKVGQFIQTDINSGENAEGPPLEKAARMYLSTTYLKPLRDVEGELSAGRASRLSQILASHDSLGKNEVNVERLIRTMIDANQTIKDDTAVIATKGQIQDLLDKITFKDKKFNPSLNMIGSKALEELNETEKHALFRMILERLSLGLDHAGKSHGLGYSNLLFMATELMLLSQSSDEFPLLLIEEPEAHLHPQLQMKFLKYLTEDRPNLQCILSTHSPHFASKAHLENLIIMNNGIAFPLRKGCTLLDSTDYPFLEKFLDVSKANMFFAKGVLIIEGDGENILLPTIAELLDRPLEDYGVSLVNVGNLAYKRYAKIYRRNNATSTLPIKVACITDLDIWPIKAEEKDGNQYGFKKRIPDQGGRKKGNTRYWEDYYDANSRLQYINNKKEIDGDNVKTFVSNDWTFEYCLCKYGLAEHVYSSIKETDDPEFSSLPTDDEERAIQIYGMIEQKSSGKTEATYKLVNILKRKYKGKPSELRELLPSYIIEAIEYVTEALPESLTATTTGGNHD